VHSSPPGARIHSYTKAHRALPAGCLRAMLLAPSEAAIGLGLSLRLHLLHVGTGKGTASAHTAFDEHSFPLDDTPWLEAHDAPDVNGLFYTICQLISAFDIREQVSELLVHALILLESLIRRDTEGVFAACTVRPLLLTAVALSAKHNIDESLTQLVPSLHRVGFTGISASSFCDMEIAFLEIVGWRIGVSRKVYTVYAFELRALAASQMPAIRSVVPQLVEIATALDAARDDPPEKQQELQRDASVSSPLLDRAECAPSRSRPHRRWTAPSPEGRPKVSSPPCGTRLGGW